MEKRLILAISLSLLALLGFQMFMGKGAKTEVTTAVTRPVSPVEQIKQFIAQKEADINEKEESKIIETECFSITFSDKGGNIKELYLKDPGTTNKSQLFSAENNADALFALKSEQAPGAENKKYKGTGDKNLIEYVYTLGGDIEITKKYMLSTDSNYIRVLFLAKNLSQAEKTFSYSMTGPSELIGTDKISGRQFLQADSYVNDEPWKTKPPKKAIEKEGVINLVSLKNRYFAFVLKPEMENFSGKLLLEKAGQDNIKTTITTAEMIIPAGGTIGQEYLFYAGPLEEKRMALLGEDIGQLVDYGIFGWLSKALLGTLRAFHKVTRNWGVAIIFLTIVVNLILFPLTRKSFVSMQQMKKIQPHIQKLKDTHKDDPQRLNKEIMELYRESKVNPFGGCLPLLLQMPIFIALYQGLMRSVELRGAHFLWVKDLAKPDAVSLPFSLPVIGAAINILPLLMIVVMIVQQKVAQSSSAEGMTEEQLQQQRTMMFMMPVVFGFLFYNMPSGLVLYWLTNSILMAIEHGVMGRSLSKG
ncbi:MAG: membrane protein insertase YidC [Candidatus Omnitrophica bacterium]|nr:membrane protein insertase YidC [Candidatus Omnitrophota bacterium]MDD5488717.1 membrane protein insertase YidC [Candidatus Omnitrophota bacterium]